MREVIIVDAACTPIGRFQGTLPQVRADHLGAIVLNSLATQTASIRRRWMTWTSPASPR